MRIRKLEMMGFKSFPERTVLQFGDGVSCIVGPNGCGKSNIIDALRWCIGEQSAKKLRGGEMMDVIFAGSKERKAVGYAEVSMTLSVDGGAPFPGEYSQFEQISVGRRLHRTGQSEYFVNQSNVRRRDIVDLFLDTGIGNNLYSFIEQGRIGEIVQARPEHRRSLIDEAAGIAKYKIRRDEAQKRLESTATQLDRAADVADEMGRRLRSLARQVLKAASFRRARALIRQNEMFLSLAKYADLAADRRALRETLRSRRGELGRMDREISRRTAALEERHAELNIVEQGSDALRDEVAEADATIREKQGEQGFLSQRKTEWGARIERLVQERKGVLQECATSEEQETAAVAALGDLEDAQRTLGEQNEALGNRLADAEAASREAASEATASMDAYLAEKARQEAIDAQRQADLERIAALPGLLLEAQELAEGIARSMEEVQGRQVALDAEKTERSVVLETLEQEVESARVKRDTVKQEVARLQREVEVLRAALAGQRGRAQDERNRRVQSGLEAQENERFVRENQQRERRLWLKSMADQCRDRLSRVREETQVSLDDQMGRLQSWCDAQRQVWFEERRALETRHRTERVELLEEWDGRARDHKDAAAKALKDEMDDARQRFGAKRKSLEQNIANSVAALDALRVEIEENDRARIDQQRACAQASARWNAMLELETDGRMSDEALRTVLPTWDSLLERTPEAERDTVLALLNDRIGLPIVKDPKDLVALSKLAVESGAIRLLWLPQKGADVSAYSERVVTVGDFAEAVTVHLETGSTVVVEATGDRIYSDGLVELGHQGREGRAQLESETAKQALMETLDDAEAAAAALDAARERLIGERDGLEQRGRDGREALDALIRSNEAQTQSLRESSSERIKEWMEAYTRDRQVAIRACDESARSEVAELVARMEDERLRLEGAKRDVSQVVHAMAQETFEMADEEERTQMRHAEAEADRRTAELLSQAEQAVHRAARELEDWEQAMQRDIADQEGAVDANRQALSDARVSLEEALGAHRDAESSYQQKLAGMAALSTSKESMDRELEQLHLRYGETRQRYETLKEEQIRSAQAKPESVETRQAVEQLEKLAARSRADRETQAKAGDRLALVKEEIAASRVKEATLAERKASLVQQIESAREAIRKTRDRVETIDEETGQLKADQNDGLTRAVKLEEELSASTVARAGLWDKLQVERERLATLKKAMEESQTSLRQVEEKRNGAQLALSEQERQITEAQGAIDGLKQRMEERYQVSLPGLLDRLEAQGKLELAPPAAASKAVEVEGKTIEAVQAVVLRTAWLSDEERIQKSVTELEQYRESLARIGEVNLMALEEYEDVRERHRDLEAQRADLEASIQRIRAAIAKMNRTCREQFRETFDLVNEAFQEMYPALVGGGRARLSLTNEDDLLETGVDIFVQPPGKRLQNLNLLSGGEKAMAAIALIMALFRVKPSPFCVLDEVDAPLDEGNGSRFNAAIREMARHSQFILVTHNRKTMECADTLVGITMPVPGVSRLVSVQLDA